MTPEPPWPRGAVAELHEPMALGSTAWRQPSTTWLAAKVSVRGAAGTSRRKHPRSSGSSKHAGLAEPGNAASGPRVGVFFLAGCRNGFGPGETRRLDDMAWFRRCCVRRGAFVGRSTCRPWQRGKEMRILFGNFAANVNGKANAVFNTYSPEMAWNLAGPGETETTSCWHLSLTLLDLQPWRGSRNWDNQTSLAWNVTERCVSGSWHCGL